MARCGYPAAESHAWLLIDSSRPAVHSEPEWAHIGWRHNRKLGNSERNLAADRISDSGGCKRRQPEQLNALACLAVCHSSNWPAKSHCVRNYHPRSHSLPGAGSILRGRTSLRASRDHHSQIVGSLDSVSSFRCELSTQARCIPPPRTTTMVVVGERSSGLAKKTSIS